MRVFAEYADLTSYWWTGDPRTRNITYGHHIYDDGYRYRGRPIGHWADQDSQILSLGGVLQKENGIGWGTTIRTGKLNEDGVGTSSSVSANTSTDYFSIDVFNSRKYPAYRLSVNTSFGWESLKPAGAKKDDGLAGYLTLTRTF